SLEPNVIARVELRVAQDAERRTELARLFRHELRERFRRSTQIEQPALRRLFHPFLGVVIPLEANGARVFEDWTDDLEHRVVDLLRLFELRLERRRNFSDRLGDCRVE